MSVSDDDVATAEVTNISPQQNVKAKELICVHFRKSYFRQRNNSTGRKISDWIECEKDRAGAVLRGVCSLCSDYHCCVTPIGKMKESHFGGNPTTAMNHLLVEHHISTTSSTPYLKCLCAPLSFEKKLQFVKACIERGVGYNFFRDSRIQDALAFKCNPEIIKKLAEIGMTKSLESMGRELVSVGGKVTLIFDCVTKDRIHTFHVLVVHTELSRSWLLCARQISDASAVGVANMLDEAVCKLQIYTEQQMVGALVCDNAPNLLGACKLFRQTEDYHDVLHFNCACHVLNLAAFDVDAVLMLGHPDLDKDLLNLGLINRIVPTRWWCKLKEYTTLMTSPEKFATVCETWPDKGRHVFIKQYVTQFELLHVVARLLEKDGSNCVMAVYTIMVLLNHYSAKNNSTFFLALLDRVLKWYAGNEVFLLIAVVSAPSLPAIGPIRHTQQFIRAVTEAIVPITDAHGKAFSKWLQHDDQTFADHRTEFHLHWVGVQAEFAPLSALAECVAHITSSEAAAERSGSRMSMIRDHRFCLLPDTAEMELIFAFNSLVVPVRDNQSVSSPLPKQPSVSADFSRTPTRKVLFGEQAQRPPQETSQPKVRVVDVTSTANELNYEDTAVLIGKMKTLTKQNVPRLDARLGCQVLMMWYWRKKSWDVLAVDDRVRMRCGIFSQGLVVKINRRSNTLVLKCGRTDANGRIEKSSLILTMAAAFTKFVVPTSSDLSWPNSDYAFKCSDDSHTTVNSPRETVLAVPTQEVEEFPQTNGFDTFSPEEVDEMVTSSGLY